MRAYLCRPQYLCFKRTAHCSEPFCVLRGLCVCPGLIYEGLLVRAALYAGVTYSFLR